MANETFSSNTEQFENILKQVNGYGAEIEKVLNDYIHSEAPRKITPSIVGLVPVSDRNKAHAKFSAPFGRQENYNLAVKVITSKPFNYLVFPDEGLGHSRGRSPLDFTGRGLEAVTPELINDMITRITEKIT